MKTLNFDEQYPEAAQALDTAINGEDTATVIIGGTHYFVSKAKPALPTQAETFTSDTPESLPDEVIAPRYEPQAGEKPSDVLTRIFAEGPLLDEQFNDMNDEELRKQAWGSRGVR